MYAIYGNIDHQYTPNVGIYTIHGSYGNHISPCLMDKVPSFVASSSQKNLLPHVPQVAPAGYGRGHLGAPQDKAIFTMREFGKKCGKNMGNLWEMW